MKQVKERVFFTMFNAGFAVRTILYCVDSPLYQRVHIALLQIPPYTDLRSDYKEIIWG